MRLLLPAFVGFLYGMVEAVPVEYYATKYDHIDVETILNNRRMVNYYVDCMLSKGPCPPEGLEFKRILPEALRTNCERCNEKQKTTTLRAIRRLRKEYPKAWAQLAAQWDPDGTYIEKFEATFNAKPTESTAVASVQIINRFGTETTTGNAIDNSISQIFTSSTAPSSTTSITTTRISSTKAPLTTSTVSTTGKTSAKVATNKPTIKINKTSAKATTNKPINTSAATTTKITKRPRPNIAASIQATVSLGPKVVGDLVRGLGALGTRVVETGAEIAGVVLKNIVRPL